MGRLRVGNHLGAPATGDNAFSGFGALPLWVQSADYVLQLTSKPSGPARNTTTTPNEVTPSFDDGGGAVVFLVAATIHIPDGRYRRAPGSDWALRTLVAASILARRRTYGTRPGLSANGGGLPGTARQVRSRGGSARRSTRSWRRRPPRCGASMSAAPPRRVRRPPGVRRHVRRRRSH